MTDSPFGIREMQTFKKLPTTAPTMKTIKPTQYLGIIDLTSPVLKSANTRALSERAVYCC
jgi:hypothetical protein